MSTTRSSTRRRTNPTNEEEPPPPPPEVEKSTETALKRRCNATENSEKLAAEVIASPPPRVSERRRRPPEKFQPDAGNETASKRRRKPAEESKEEKQAVDGGGETIGGEKSSEMASKPTEESKEEKQEDMNGGKASEAEKLTEVAPPCVSGRRRKQPSEKSLEDVSGEEGCQVEESEETAPVLKPTEKSREEKSEDTRKVEEEVEEKKKTEEDEGSRKTRKVNELSEKRSKKKNDKLSPVVVFAHGAGAPSTSDWMIRWRNLLTKAFHAVEVVTFDYPYISGGRKAPPKAEKLVEFHSEVVKKAAAKYPEHPLILVGKSMGSRISCMVASEDGICASAVVCLGYPLKGMNGSLRDETLLQLSVPIMFVQGSNDAFCPLQLLESVRKKMKVVNALHVIDGGDHSFQVGKKHLELTGSTREQAEVQAVEAVAKFISRIYGESVSEGRKMTISSSQPVRSSANLFDGKMVSASQPMTKSPKAGTSNKSKRKNVELSPRSRKSQRIMNNRKSIWTNTPTDPIVI